jgi:hypothetical protein
MRKVLGIISCGQAVKTKRNAKSTGAEALNNLKMVQYIVCKQKISTFLMATDTENRKAIKKQMTHNNSYDTRIASQKGM